MLSESLYYSGFSLEEHSLYKASSTTVWSISQSPLFIKKSSDHSECVNTLQGRNGNLSYKPWNGRKWLLRACCYSCSPISQAHLLREALSRAVLRDQGRSSTWNPRHVPRPSTMRQFSGTNTKRLYNRSKGKSKRNAFKRQRQLLANRKTDVEFVKQKERNPGEQQKTLKCLQLSWQHGNRTQITGHRAWTEAELWLGRQQVLAVVGMNKLLLQKVQKHLISLCIVQQPVRSGVKDFQAKRSIPAYPSHFLHP